MRLLGAQKSVGCASRTVPHLRVMAEPTPPGTWNITQFEADREPGGLFHSQAYQNPAAQLFIARWVLERARSDAAMRI